MIKPLPIDDLIIIYQKLEFSIIKLQNKHVFITGATGFIGSWLLEALIYISEHKGLKLSISILTRNKAKFCSNYPYLAQASCLDILTGDIRDLSSIKVNQKIDYIIHGAAETANYLDSTQALFITDTIVKGTKNILELAREQGDVKKILFLSSGAVYGKQLPEQDGLNEVCNTAPDCSNALSSYGESKRYAELLCSIYYKKFKIPFVTARCFSFIGPRLPLHTHFAVGNFFRNILDDKDIIILGNGKSIRSYLYAADLAIWLLVMLLEAKPAKVYNVGSNAPYTIEQTAKTAIRICRPSLQYKILNKNNNSDIYTPNINKILKELPIEIYHDLQKAVAKTFQWYKK